MRQITIEKDFFVYGIDGTRYNKRHYLSNDNVIWNYKYEYGQVKLIKPIARETDRLNNCFDVCEAGLISTHYKKEIKD